jgi:hypothetical protein
MVALEPGETLLLYIAATAEAVSMVLIAERSNPHNPHELGSFTTDDSRSQDPGPSKEPRTMGPAGSQLLEICPSHDDTGSQPPDAALGPHDQTVVGSQTSEVLPDPKDRELPEPTPMEIDAPDPPRRIRTIQQPVYYISEVPHEAKTRYLEVHKLLYVVLITSRELHHYFQAHKISVVSSYPLRDVLHNPNVTGNIAKWAAELSKFELDFISCHAIKSQVLADFIVDWMPPESHPGGPNDNERESRAPVFTRPHWTLFFGDSSRKQGEMREFYSSLHMGTNSSIWCT